MLAVLLLRSMQKRSALKRETSLDRSDVQRCRTCMGADELQPIFCVSSGASNDIAEQLLLVGGIQIKKDDGLPQQICGQCIKSVNAAISFRNTCRTTQETLISSVLNAPKIRKGNFQKSTTKFRSNGKVKRKLRRSKSRVIQDDYGDEHFDYDAPCDSPRSNLVELYHKTPANVNVMEKKEDVHVPASLRCEVCEKIFKNKHTYIRHMVVHTGDYPYMCEQCGKGLMAYTHLMMHMKAKHGMERTDKCSYCGYLALNKSILEIHERRHTGEKPFVCDHCGMGFHRRANLLQHLPVHLTTKTAQCSQCPSSFKSIRFLRTHYNKTHKQKKYTYMCHICKNYFKTTGNVRMHLFRIHGVPKEEQGPVQRVTISSNYL